MDDIVVSAPGKVILHGEHAVVYGKVAIAASLNLRTYLRLQKNNDGKVNVNFPNIDISASWPVEKISESLSLPLCDANKPEAATEDVMTKLRTIAGLADHEMDTKQLALVTSLFLYCAIAGSKGSLPSIDIKVVSLQPVSAGLGSSAAFSVCLTACLLKLCGLVSMETKDGSWSQEELNLINSWAYFGEKILHGNPSGIDNSISTFGGAIQFQAGKITPLEKVPKLKILLVNTGVPRSTKVLVAGVRQRYEKYRAIIEPVLESIEAISQHSMSLLSMMADTVSLENYRELEDLIDMNQCHLGALGVSHPALEEIVSEAAQHKLHAKLTGAGGGGCAFILISSDTPAETVADIRSKFESRKLQCWETTVGSAGVMLHKLNEENGQIQKLFS